MSLIVGAVDGKGGRWVAELKPGQTRLGQCVHRWEGDKAKGATCANCLAYARFGADGKVEYYDEPREDDKPAAVK